MDPDLSSTLAAWNNVTGDNSTDGGGDSAPDNGYEGSDMSLGGSNLMQYAPEVMSVASTGLNILGTEMEGSEKAAADEYNAQLAIEQGQFQVNQTDKQETDFAGTQRAMYAKAGVTQEGSPSDVMLKTATNFELDKQISMYDAQSKANMDNYAAAVAKNQAQFEVGQELLSGGLKMAGSMAGLFNGLGDD
jgi:hypothetical protein